MNDVLAGQVEALFGYKRLLRARDERIAELETENAMLYLKLAECQGEVNLARKEKRDAARIHREFRESISLTLQRINFDLKILKKELIDLRDTVVLSSEEARSVTREYVEKITRFIDQAVDLRAAADAKSRLVESEVQLAHVKERYAIEKLRRQNLHNTLVELRGNIRVHCRIRPLMDFDCIDRNESDSGGWRSEVPVINASDEETILVQSVRQNFRAELPPAKMYEYDRVYGPEDGQITVFQDVKPLIVSLLDGYNACIMAYGQTGSGKTYTMLGKTEQIQPYYDEFASASETEGREGIIPQAAREIFRHLEEKKDDFLSYSIDISLLEIYNNEIRDLISGDCKLEIVSGANGAMDVPSLETRPVSNVNELMKLVRYGMRRRAEDATLIHEHSSRSHFVATLTVTIVLKCSNDPSPNVIVPEIQLTPPSSPTRFSEGLGYSPRRRDLVHTPKTSPLNSPALSCTSSMTDFTVSAADQPKAVKTKLQLVDLAGSECVGMSGVTGSALRESSYINRSLSALADVLGALAERRTHIPYRNSKLTYLLQDSIGGDAKLLIVACISPTQRYLVESQQTLGFGLRARQVQRGPARKRRPLSPGSSRPSSPTPSARTSKFGIGKSRSSPVLFRAKAQS